jgi:hypothetical protein
MLEIPPLPPSNQRINKTQVSEKDPHHERDRKKQQHAEIEDEIILGNHDKAGDKKENAPKPETPLSGHLDIEA